MAEYLIRLKAPLDEPHVTRIWSGELVYGSKQADRVIVTATSGGEKVTLTGTVTAKLLQADGNTLTWTGVLEDGEAQVLLPANAYEVEGCVINTSPVTPENVTFGAEVCDGVDIVSK